MLRRCTLSSTLTSLTSWSSAVSLLSQWKLPFSLRGEGKLYTQVLASSHGFIHFLFRTGNLYSTLNQWLIIGPMYSCRGGAPLLIHSQLVSQGGLSLFPRGRAPCQPQLCQFAQCRYNFVGKEYYDVDTIEATQRHRSSQMITVWPFKFWVQGICLSTPCCNLAGM